MEPKRRRSCRSSVAAAVSVGAVALLAPASSHGRLRDHRQGQPRHARRQRTVIRARSTPSNRRRSRSSFPRQACITSWSTKANENAGQQAALKTLRQTGTPPGAFTYAIAGSSALEPLTPSTLNRFNTRISVQPGDKLGYFFPSGADDSQACRYTAGGGSDDTRGGPSSGQTGSSFTSTDDDSSTTKFMNLEATIETDADGDGFGDDTQDRCLGASGGNSGCPAGPPPIRRAGRHHQADARPPDLRPQLLRSGLVGLGLHHPEEEAQASGGEQVLLQPL